MVMERVLFVLGLALTICGAEGVDPSISPVDRAVLSVDESSAGVGSISPVDDQRDDGVLSLESRILSQIEISAQQKQGNDQIDLHSLESQIVSQIKAPPRHRVPRLGSSPEGEHVGAVALPMYIKSDDGKCVGIAEGHHLQMEQYLCSKFEPTAHWIKQGDHLQARTKPQLCIARGASGNVKIDNCDVLVAGWTIGNSTSPQITVDASETMCMAVGNSDQAAAAEDVDSSEPATVTQPVNETSLLAVRDCNSTQHALRVHPVLEKTDITEISCFSDWSSPGASIPHTRHCVKRLQATDSHRDVNLNLEEVTAPSPDMVQGLLALFDSAATDSAVTDEDGCATREDSVRRQLEAYAAEVAIAAAQAIPEEPVHQPTNSSNSSNGSNSSNDTNSSKGTSANSTNSSWNASSAEQDGQLPTQFPITEVRTIITFDCDLHKSVTCKYKDSAKAPEEECSSTKTCDCQGYGIQATFLMRGQAEPVSGCVRQVQDCSAPKWWPQEFDVYDPFRGDACRSPCAIF
jgi:hypothetical protein